VLKESIYGQTICSPTAPYYFKAVLARSSQYPCFVPFVVHLTDPHGNIRTELLYAVVLTAPVEERKQIRIWYGPTYFFDKNEKVTNTLIRESAANTIDKYV